MSRISLFNSPLLLGFDHFERALDRVSKAAADGYPPYNVEQTGDHTLRITLAVAGFTMDDLNIQVEDNQLVVRGKQADDRSASTCIAASPRASSSARSCLPRGSRSLEPALDNGLLHIDLVRPSLESRVRTVEIRQAGTASQGKIGVGKATG